MPDNFIIFHADSLRDFGFDESVDKVVARTKYSLEARINTYDIDKAYELSQNIDSNWTENPEVIFLGRQGGARSTSIGDLIASYDGDHLVEVSVVQGVGFEVLDRNALVDKLKLETGS